MALTQRQTEFLNLYIRETQGKKLVFGGKKRKIAKKQERAQQFSIVQDKVFATFKLIDPSCPDYDSLLRACNDVESYGAGGKYSDGIKFANELISKLEKAKANYPIKPVSPTQPKTPAPVNPLRQAKQGNPLKIGATRDEVMALQKAATDLDGQSNPAGLDSPKLIKTALGDATTLLKGEGDVLELTDALQAFDAAQDQLWEFFAAWKQAGVTERLARKDMPTNPAAMVAEIDTDWETSRDGIGIEFSKLGETASPDPVIASLSNLQTRIAQRRDDLRKSLNDAAVALRSARQIYAELSQIKIYDLVEAGKKLDAAETGFNNATNQTAIDTALRNVREFERLLEQAKTQVPEAMRAVQKRYEELLHKVNLDILKAQTVRGAFVEESPVKQEIDKVIQLRDAATQSMRDAVTVSEAEAAIEKLKLVQKVGIESKAGKLAKEEKEQLEADTKALPLYERAFDELVRARNVLAARPGAQAQLKEVELLISRTRVAGSGRPKGGFAAALKAIEHGKVAELLRLSDVAEKDYIDNKLEGFAKTAFEEAKKWLIAYEECHDAQSVIVQREALAKATETKPPPSGTDPKDRPATAFSELNKLAIKLQESTIKQRKRQETLKQLAQERKVQLEELEKKLTNPRDPQLSLLRGKLESANGLIKEWRLDDADLALEEVQSNANGALTAFDQLKTKWEKTKQELLAAIKLTEPLLKAWPPLKSEANAELTWMKDLLQKQESGRISMEEAHQWATNSLERGQDKLTELKAGANIDDTTDYAGLDDALEAANKEWAKELELVRQQIRELDAALKKQGVTGGAEMLGWDTELKGINGQWLAAQTSGLQLAGKEKPADAVNAAKTKMLKVLATFSTNLPKADALTDKSPSVVTGKEEQAKVDKKLAFDRANRMLLELRALRVTPLPKDADTRLGIYAETATAQQVELWRKLAEELDGCRLEHEKSVQESIKSHRDTADKLAKGIKTKFLHFKEEKFKDFFDSMRDQVDDALAMLNAVPPDPALIMAAGEKLAAVNKAVGDAKGKGGEGAVTLDDVLKVQKELNALLGVATILDRMPDTHRQLLDELNQAFKRATGMSPDQGVRELEALRGPILDAGTRSLYLQQEFKGFEVRLKEVKARFKQMQKHTGTTLGDRPLAYIEAFDARLGEATGLAGQEGQVQAALTKLDELDGGLLKLLAMTPEAATEGIKKLEADAQADQREVRDIAATFNATIDYWQDVLLKEIKVAVKLRAKKEEDGEYKSLAGAVKSIAKTVAPYLAVISKLPSKRLAANKAPDMEMMRKAFSQAYLQLNQLTGPAMRLRDGTGSTNVTLETDMLKLDADWGQKVDAAIKSLTELAKSLEGVANKVDPAAKPGEAGHVPAEVQEKLKQAIPAVQNSLKLLANRFLKSEFSVPLTTLADKKTSMADRKKAREQALRKVRGLVADVAGNPMLQKLYEGSRKGLLDLDIREPISFLRAELKKIELAVLVGI